MRRLPRILLLLLAAIIVIVALLVSGLRLVMPHLNSYRSDILQTISRVSGVTVDASELQGKWENFGPTLQVRNLNVVMPDDGKLTIGRVNLALNVWQSLLHWRWQFRDLTFWQLRLETNHPLLTSDQQKTALSRRKSTICFCASLTTLICVIAASVFSRPLASTLSWRFRA